MLSNPAAHTEDPTHGEMMIHYSSLIDAHQGQAPAKTIEEMVAVFERQRNKRQRSLIRDVANPVSYTHLTLPTKA